MGYTTEFDGRVYFDKPLTEAQKNYINTFSGTRRMRRDPAILRELYGGEFGLDGNYGEDGAYFARSDGNYGQTKDASVLDYNEAPGKIKVRLTHFNEDYAENNRRIENGLCQPGLWCQWIVSADGTYLEWDGGEKFYHYIEWLKYLIEHFFKKWNVALNGEISWQGEDADDKGRIIVINSAVSTE